MGRSIIVLFLLLHATFSRPKKVNTEFLNLISTATSIKATDNALKAVLQLLNDLKGANEEAQKKADQQFTVYEEQILNDLSTFTGILNSNSATVEDAQGDLDAVIDKIQQTRDYLDWNEKRRNNNNVKLETLAEQRCEANSLFIDALREYKEALDVLEWVHSDLESKDKHNSAFIQQEDLNEYADKLSMYATLFKESALSDFVKLGEDKQINLVQVKDDDEEIQNNEQIANNVVSEVVRKVQALIEKLRLAIKNLEEQEITSANDFVDYRNNLLNEQASLFQEYDARQKFLNSLLNDQELAVDVVNQAKEILSNTQRILQQTQEQYNQQKQQRQIEKQKRHEENQQIQEIILIYKNKIADAKLFLQEKVGDSFISIKENDDE